MADLRKLLGANVRRLREERGLTQAQLAEAAGRSVDMISRLERGEAAASLDTISELASVLKVGPAALFWHPDEAADPLPKHQMKLWAKVAALPSEKADWASDLLDLVSRAPR